MKVAFSKKVLLFASGVLALSILSIGIVNATGDRFGYWSQPRTSVQTIKVFSAPFTYSDILKKGGQFSLGQLPRDTQITSAFVEVATPFKTNEPNGVQHVGYSSGLLLPEVVTRRMNNGEIHNEIMADFDKKFDLPEDNRDTWSRYTGGFISRQISLEEALRNALIQCVPMERNLYNYDPTKH